MDNDEQNVDGTTETQEEVELEEVEKTEESEDTAEDEGIEEAGIDWKQRALDAEKAIINNKKKAKTEVKSSTSSKELSTKDIIALTRANIADDDIDEVLEYAKYKKVSVTEALQSPVVKATLNLNKEIRESANAVASTSGRRAGNAVSDERLLENASKGLLPESDADMNRLAKLRLQGKR